MADASFIVDVILNIQNNIKKSIAPAVAQTKSLTSQTTKLSTQLTNIGNKASLKKLFEGIPTKPLDPLFRDFQKLATVNPMKPIEKSFKQLNSVMLQQQKVSKQTFGIFRKATANTVKSTNKATGAVKKFNFAWLGVMFLGMALQRTFGNLFRGIISGYTDFADKNDAFTGKVLELSGAFTFLKYTIGKAFADSAFGKAVMNVVIAMTDGLSRFFKKNPGIAVFFTALAAALYGIGTALAFIGQGKLGYDAIKSILNSRKQAEGATKAISNLDGAIRGLGIAMSIGTIIVGVKGLKASLESGDIVGGFLNSIGIAMAAVGGVLAATGNINGIILTIAGLVVMAISKIGLEDRAANKAAQEFVDSEEVNGLLTDIEQSLGAKALKFIPGIGIIVDNIFGARKEAAEEISAIGNVITAYKDQLGVIEELQTGLDNATDVEAWTLWKTQVTAAKDELQRLNDVGKTIEAGTLEGTPFSDMLTDIDIAKQAAEMFGQELPELLQPEPFSLNVDEIDTSILTESLDVTKEKLDALSEMFLNNIVYQNGFANTIDDTTIPALTREETEVNSLISAYNRLTRAKSSASNNSNPYVDAKLGSNSRDSYSPVKE